MATLNRRVQVLFDADQYDRLEAEAKAQRSSVGALIRESVEVYLERERSDAAAALRQLWKWADEQPPTGPIDWQEEKRLNEREILRDIP